MLDPIPDTLSASAPVKLELTHRPSNGFRKRLPKYCSPTSTSSSLPVFQKADASRQDAADHPDAVVEPERNSLLRS